MIIFRVVLAMVGAMLIGIHFNSPVLFMGIYLGLVSLIFADWK